MIILSELAHCMPCSIMGRRSCPLACIKLLFSYNSMITINWDMRILRSIHKSVRQPTCIRCLSRINENIGDADLRRTLQSLACGKKKILRKDPAGRDVNDTDVFRFNAGFQDERYHVHINSIQSKETVCNIYGFLYARRADIVNTISSRKNPRKPTTQ